MKARKHTFAITVTFDKSCAPAHALREVKDTIHGEFYPTQRTDDEPGSYWVRRIARIPAKAVRQ
jgi:hypothetical protein